MPVINRLARVAAKPIPRMISPKGRSILDYLMVGSFFGAASWFWRGNRRAATASMLCGSARLAVTLLTDHVNGISNVITPEERREIDLGLAAIVATMPEFLAFKDTPQKNFFLAQGALLTLSSELTRHPEHSRSKKARLRAA